MSNTSKGRLGTSTANALKKIKTDFEFMAPAYKMQYFGMFPIKFEHDIWAYGVCNVSEQEHSLVSTNEHRTEPLGPRV